MLPPHKEISTASPETRSLHRYFRWFVWVLGALFAAYLLRLLFLFSFAYTDMDQVLMWLGTQEFRAGRFHMPRYFGQDYGSMLEALVAVPMRGLPYSAALPLAATVLLFLPYVLSVYQGGASARKWGIMLMVLAAMPVEYFLIGTMPRDYGSGLAITSLALPLIGRKAAWSRVLVGVFCMLGWSANNNAALFGAVVTMYVLFDEHPWSWRSFLLVGAGYAAGAGLHALTGLYVHAHPENVVHHAWSFHYAWKQVWDGWANLDRHFKWVTPLFRGQGWLLPVMFALLLGVALYQRKRGTWVAALTLLAIALASFGILKVHDGYDTIFLPHERMFMAMPLCLVFLLQRVAWDTRVLAVCALLALGNLLYQGVHLSESIARNVDPQQKDNLMFPHYEVSDYQADCERLIRLMDTYQAEALLIGPGRMRYGFAHSNGCACFDPSKRMVSPDYERKTWVMRELDRPVYSNVLWITTELQGRTAEELEAYSITPVPGNGGIEYVYAIRGKGVNPLTVVRSLGFQVSNH